MSGILGKIKGTLNDWSKTRLTTPTVVIRILRPVVKDTIENFFLNRKEVKTFKEEDWLNDNSIEYEVIYGSESEITESGQNLNSVHRLYSSTHRQTGAPVTNIIENKKQLKEGIIGIQIEEASVYGSFIQLSVADFTNDVLNNVRSNDLIFAWVFDLDDLIKRFDNPKLKFPSLISSDAFSQIIDKAILPTSEGKGITPHFSGFITAVHKHIKDKSRTNIEGLDLNKYLQHYSIPKSTPNSQVDRIELGQDAKKLVGKGSAFSALNSFFANAILEALKKDFIDLDIGNDIETIKYEKDGETIINEEFLIRPIEKIDYRIGDNKVYLSFVKGSVSILTIHPLMLLKCVYKYFFHLIGLGVYMYPDFDFGNIQDYIGHDEIDNKNLISVGIIYEPYNNDEHVSKKFNDALRNASDLKDLLTTQKMMYSFSLSGDEILYVSEYTKHVTVNQALFTVDGQIRYDVGEPVPCEKIFGFEVDNSSSYYVELVNFVRNNIYRTFKETMDVNTLLDKNAYTMRSEKFLPVNQYISTTLNKLNDGVPLLFLIKTLFYTSTGIFEPVYTWTETEGSKSPPKILNSIRNTMWIKIDFELTRKNNKIYVRAVLKNNFVSHRDVFSKKVEIKEEDILEYQSSTIRYPLSVMNIKTAEGYMTITDTSYITEGENNYMMFHPSSILALNLDGMVSKKLPIFTNSYTVTETSFSPSIYKSGMTENSSILFNKTGPPNNVLTVHHQEQRFLKDEWNKDASSCHLIRYKNKGEENMIFGYLSKNTEFTSATINRDFVFGDAKIGNANNLNFNVGVMEYINPTSIFKELEKVKKLIERSGTIRGSVVPEHGAGNVDDPVYSSYGAFDYRQYRNISINMIYDKNDNPYAKFIYEDILGLSGSNQTIKFKPFLDKVIKYFYEKAEMRSDKFWARKLPTVLWVYENRKRQGVGVGEISAFWQQNLYQDIFYDFEKEYYVTGEDEPMYLKNTEVSKYIYALKIIMAVYTAVSRYYDEHSSCESFSIYSSFNRHQCGE